MTTRMGRDELDRLAGDCQRDVVVSKPVELIVPKQLPGCRVEAKKVAVGAGEEATFMLEHAHILASGGR